MFVKATNGEIVQSPYSIGMLRRDNPNTSFPRDVPAAVLAEYGVYEVKTPPAPDHDPETHFVEYAPVPTFVGGAWVYAPSVRPLSVEQIAERTASRASAIRIQRDSLLKDCDWVVVKAVDQNAQDSFGIQIPVVWLTYRQALRDITAQPGFPDTVTWPAKPE
jgi:hypothetical protein